MMNVLLAGPYPRPGGMAGTYGRILDNIRRSEVLAGEVSFRPLELTLPADGGYLRRGLVDAWRSAKAIAGGADVLHIILQYENGVYREHPLLRAAQACGAATVADIRAGRLQWCVAEKHNRVQRWMLADLLRSSDAVLVECPRDTSFVREKYGREAVWVPNVVRRSELVRSTPARLPPGDDEPLRLIYSGRYLREKGILDALAALARLRPGSRRVEYHLTGAGTDALVLDAIRGAGERPPPGTAVLDHGWDVPDLQGLLASTHVFVMPTYLRSEGHPSSLVEAMAAGLALILSPWPHLADLVPEEGAIVVPPHDPDAIARAIESYASDSDRLRAAGRANRAFVEQHLTDAAVHPRLLGVYRSIRTRRQGQVR
ncbi:MAG: glycosyltransferase family 4 protein [Deltaproteobacteria bacterium]|nr:glycosyltransferase family 4 protein [Deltaproteobacteria bacterium]